MTKNQQEQTQTTGFYPAEIICFCLFHTKHENCFLSVKPVFSLVKNLVCVFFKNLCRNFLFSVCGETMQNHSAFVCYSYNRVVNLITLENVFAFLSLRLLPH